MYLRVAVQLWLHQRSNHHQWKQSGDFLWKVKEMKENWIQTTFLTFIWFLWRCVKALESEIRPLLCRGNRSCAGMLLRGERIIYFFFFKMVLLELILQTLIPGPNRGSWMDVIRSWLITLKIQDSFHTWKSTWRVVTRGHVGDIVMNGSVMKHRNSLAPTKQCCCSSGGQGVLHLQPWERCLHDVAELQGALHRIWLRLRHWSWQFHACY